MSIAFDVLAEILNKEILINLKVYAAKVYAVVRILSKYELSYYSFKAIKEK